MALLEEAIVSVVGEVGELTPAGESAISFSFSFSGVWVEKSVQVVFRFFLVFTFC